jgi:hypothetical protein
VRSPSCCVLLPRKKKRKQPTANAVSTHPVHHEVEVTHGAVKQSALRKLVAPNPQSANQLEDEIKKGEKLKKNRSHVIFVNRRKI